MDHDEITARELALLLSSGTGVQVEPGGLHPTTTFDELGVDSLGLLGVITSIERSRKVALPPEAQEVASVQQFLDILNDSLRKAA
jgi:acyl carrier protein